MKPRELISVLPPEFLLLSPCGDARVFAASHPDPQTAWDKCDRADWMLWLIARTRSRIDTVNAALDCAESALPFVKDGATKAATLLTIHVTRRWTEGRADLEDVRAAYAIATATANLGIPAAGTDVDHSAPYAATSAAYSAGAAYAATAYAATAYAAIATDYAATAATAYAATAAYAGADYAAYATAAAYAGATAAATARTRHHKLMCELIRNRFPACPLEIKLNP